METLLSKIKKALKVFLVPSPLFCAGVVDLKSPDAWVKYADQQIRGERSLSQSTMDIVTPRWTRSLKLETGIQGQEEALIFIREPAKEKGIGTLKIGATMWNYYPKMRRKISVSPSMLLSSWMGSDFTNDDLLKASSFVEDYDHSFLKDEKVGDKTFKSIENRAKPTSKVVWPKVVILADQKDCLPRFQRYYDKEGKLIRTLSLSDIKTFDGHKVPAVWVMREEGVTDKQTTLTYDKIQYKVKFASDHFTERTLTK